MGWGGGVHDEPNKTFTVTKLGICTFLYCGIGTLVADVVLLTHVVVYRAIAMSNICAARSRKWWPCIIWTDGFLQA